MTATLGGTVVGSVEHYRALLKIAKRNLKQYERSVQAAKSLIADYEQQIRHLTSQPEWRVK